MKTLLVLIAIGLMIIAGCSKAAQQAPPPAGPLAQPPAQQENIEQIQGDLVNVDTIDQELNLSDLDNLDQDLNFG
jgi:hypothetical protein